MAKSLIDILADLLEDEARKTPIETAVHYKCPNCDKSHVFTTLDDDYAATIVSRLFYGKGEIVKIIRGGEDITKATLETLAGVELIRKMLGL